MCSGFMGVFLNYYEDILDFGVWNPLIVAFWHKTIIPAAIGGCP